MAKKLVAVMLGLAVAILNPLAACSLLGGFDFGAKEMRAAVEGTWTVTSPAGEDAPAVAYTITIRQGTGAERKPSAAGGLVAPAAACGDRSFVATAAACLDTSRMPLDVQIVEGP